MCNAHISRRFCPFGFPLKHTIAAYAFRFYLENGIVFKRSFGAFGGSILRACHFCLRYCIHCTVVAWAEYTLYLERVFRFFGYPFLIIIPISHYHTHFSLSYPFLDKFLIRHDIVVTTSFSGCAAKAEQHHARAVPHPCRHPSSTPNVQPRECKQLRL